MLRRAGEQHMDATRRITTSDLAQTEVIAARAGGEALHQGLGDARGEPAGIQRTGRRSGLARRRRGTGGVAPLKSGRQTRRLGKGLDMGKHRTGARGVRDRTAGARSALGCAVALALAAVAAATPFAPRRAQAREIELTAGRTSATVRISIGKSESVRTDGGFSEVIVSDPEIADAIPLTDRSLSILGKKIGTARVSVYGEGKKLVGVFDVEVSYDTSRLGSELRAALPARALPRLLGQRPHHAGAATRRTP